MCRLAIVLVLLGGVGCGHRTSSSGGYYNPPRFSYHDRMLREQCGGDYTVNPYTGTVSHVFCGHSGGFIDYGMWYSKPESYYFYNETDYYFYWRH